MERCMVGIPRSSILAVVVKGVGAHSLIWSGWSSRLPPRLTVLIVLSARSSLSTSSDLDSHLVMVVHVLCWFSFLKRVGQWQLAASCLVCIFVGRGLVGFREVRLLLFLCKVSPACKDKVEIQVHGFCWWKTPTEPLFHFFYSNLGHIEQDNDKA
jgi:hypothetical protein